MLEKIEFYESLLGEGVSIDEAIGIIKNAGGGLMETVIILKKRFNLEISEADSLALNSTYWAKEKENVLSFRKQLGEFVEKNTEDSS